jgi:alkylation response protein AidB-like acyl-CoA dehydrogenase
MTDDLDQYRATMRAWLEAHLPRRDGGALRSAHAFDADRLARDRARQKQVYEAGYLGITIPSAYGGEGLTAAHQRIWSEESAPFAVPLPGGVASGVTMGIVLPTILVHGSEAQKREWVPRMLSGEEIWVQLLSEPGAGSDLAGLLTRATRDGETWVLNGTKVWSSGALSADFGICLARTDWDAPKHKGLTWFKVPLHHERVTVRPIREINGSAEFCEEFLDDLTVGDDMVIGEVNGGWPIANTMLGFERGAGGGHAEPAGPSRRRLSPDLVALAEARGLADDPATRQLVARGHILDWLQGELTKRVVHAMTTGSAEPTSASLIKLALGRRDPERALLAMELAGRAGIAWSEDDDTGGQAAAINLLNARIYSIAGGSNEIQRNIISERLLGLPREPSADGDRPFREVINQARAWGAKRS